MRLTELTQGYHASLSGPDPEISAVTEDSRRVEPGTLFVAVRGTKDDGHRYVEDAIRRGAVAIAIEHATAVNGASVVHVPSARAALAEFAARFFGHPARELTLIGFTGTFGKTSTSAILRELLAAGGARPGVLGSLGARFGSFHDPGSGLTTPAPVEMHRALRGLKQAGADTVIMEVTSHALQLGRAEGLTFNGGLLAAIMPGEHTDFHRSYDHYVAAKRRFLDHLSPAAAFAYDADNHAARRLAGEASVAACVGFSLERRPVGPVGGDRGLLCFGNLALDETGARFTVRGVRMHSPLLGRGHLRNVALAVTYAAAADVPLEVCRRVVRTLRPLRRRMERYEAEGRIVLDDTAGHPDSIQATMEVASMLRRSPDATGRCCIVYAIRGSRGTGINRRNARALADLAAEHGIETVLLTASADAAGPHDRATAEEIEAARSVLASRGQRYHYYDALSNAIEAALAGTGAGDLLVFIGAQGMNEARRMLPRRA